MSLKIGRRKLLAGLMSSLGLSCAAASDSKSVRVIWLVIGHPEDRDCHIAGIYSRQVDAERVFDVIQSGAYGEDEIGRYTLYDVPVDDMEDMERFLELKRRA
jgi:hypothetical protein